MKNTTSVDEYNPVAAGLDHVAWPTAQQIIKVLSNHFGAPEIEVIAWLSEMNFAEAA